MENSLDLSKIVSIIAQNPELITTIKGLLGSSEEKATDAGEALSQPKEAEASLPVSEQSADDKDKPNTVSVMADETLIRRKRRKELLCALKPYVSHGRSKAIDSMLSFAEVLDVLNKR